MAAKRETKFDLGGWWKLHWRGGFLNRGLTDASEGAEKGLKAEKMAQAQPEARNVYRHHRCWIATQAPRNLSVGL